MQLHGGAGGHVQGAGSGKHAVGVCDDGAGARGRSSIDMYKMTVGNGQT